MAKTIVDYYEDYLHMESPEVESLEYASDALFNFIDEFFEELVCLKREPKCPELFTPYSTHWVKEAVYSYLRSQSEESHDMKNAEVNGHSDPFAMDTS